MLQKDLTQTSSPVVVTEKPTLNAPSRPCIAGQPASRTWPGLKSRAVHTAAASGAASHLDTQVVLLFEAVLFMQAVQTCV